MIQVCLWGARFRYSSGESLHQSCEVPYSPRIMEPTQPLRGGGTPLKSVRFTPGCVAQLSARQCRETCSWRLPGCSEFGTVRGLLSRPSVNACGTRLRAWIQILAPICKRPDAAVCLSPYHWGGDEVGDRSIPRSFWTTSLAKC